MSIPSIEQLMSGEVSGGGAYTPLPIGTYNAVITNCEVRQGPKGPYLNLEATIHDDDYRGRKVWRNSSFSEKAVFMPGGPANLVQSTQLDVPQGTEPAQLPYAVASAIVGEPVTVEVDHEQVMRGGEYQVNPDGSPELRATIKAFSSPDEAFAASIDTAEAAVQSGSSDLPF